MVGKPTIDSRTPLGDSFYVERHLGNIGRRLEEREYEHAMGGYHENHRYQAYLEEDSYYKVVQSFWNRNKGMGRDFQDGYESYKGSRYRYIDDGYGHWYPYEQEARYYGKETYESQESMKSFLYDEKFANNIANLKKCVIPSFNSKGSKESFCSKQKEQKMHKRSLEGNLQRSKRSLKTTRAYENEVIKLNTLNTRRLVRCILKIARHSHRPIYQEVTLVGEPSGTTSSSSYSLREIVPERKPTQVIDLSDRLGTLIEEDPSEPKSDPEMIPEPEGVASTDAGGMGAFVAGSSPIAASPTPMLPVESVSSFPALLSLLRGGVREHDIFGYCLWHEQWVEVTSQQIAELREEISRMDALFYTTCQAR
ncbi:hypothetical protein M9H77_02464 [Catharanthus roseus]|uniref:Uncharacterized protein n=1 Tax=Catharanthus roseus TaxID=4058 RepID=A0ACC0C8S5_CATRO|nr:hypothetical protein M9H77_02464 [Catharanthus roseus]